MKLLTKLFQPSKSPQRDVQPPPAQKLETPTTKPTPWVARQGDILIRAIENIPVSAVPMEGGNDRYVLAEGEVTGHHHALLDNPGVRVFEEVGEPRYLDLAQETFLVHEEHAAIAIPAGRFEVIRQREYDPAQDRQVRD